MNFFRLTILERYFLRDVVVTTISVALVLTGIVLSSKLHRFLNKVSSGEWSVDVVMPILGLVLINNMVLIIPMTIFLSVLLIVGKLYEDNEMLAMNSCGIGSASLYRPLTALAIGLGIIVGVMVAYVIPISKHMILLLEEQAISQSAIVGVMPGRFQESANGQQTLYVEKFNPQTHRAENVFLYRKPKNREGFAEIITARSASQYQAKAAGYRIIVLQEGFLYRLYRDTASQQSFKVLRFDRYEIPFDETTRSEVRLSYEAKPTLELFNTDNRIAQAELHWRIAMILSPILFTWLGLPVGQLRQNEHRYSRILIGVLVYVIYFHLLYVGQIWLEQATLPSWLGLWWVHLILVLYGLWHWRRQVYI